MCRHSLPKTIWRGQRPGCCTTITSRCLVFPNISCRIRERNFVGRSLQLCAACWEYHPQTNGSAERVHQTLQRMIGKLDPEKRRKWPAHIGSIIIAYNSTRSLVTGYSPYYLMIGRRPRLPIDLLFPTRWMQMLTCTIDEYVASLYDRLWESLAIAQDCAIKEAQRQKWLR